MSEGAKEQPPRARREAAGRAVSEVAGPTRCARRCPQQAAERTSECGLATIGISPRTRLLAALERALAPLRRRSPGPLRLIVAFSGGPDSLALLWAVAQLTPERTRPLAAHLDHALDAGSAGRAEHAARLARRLGVP